DFCWEVAIAKVAPEKALAACDQALQREPDESGFLDSRGMALLQLGRFDEAIAAYDAALVKRPKQSTSLYGRGVAKKQRCKCASGPCLSSTAAYASAWMYEISLSLSAPSMAMADSAPRPRNSVWCLSAKRLASSWMVASSVSVFSISAGISIRRCTRLRSRSASAVRFLASAMTSMPSAASC